MKKIRIVFPDLNGCLRGKVIPEAQFDKESKIRTPRSVLSQDIEGEEADVLEEFSPTYHDHDVIVLPDQSTAYTSAINPNIRNVIGDVQELNGVDHPVAPRTILKKAISELGKLGYEMKSAAEIEFYLTDERGELLSHSEIDMPFGDVNSLHALQDFLDDLEAQTKAIGLETEAILNEAGTGQLEITYGALSPLETADKIVFFKQAVRDVARKHGMGASFLAKPDANNVSSSQHVHLSLWKDGKQATATDQQLFESFLAGMIVHAHETFSIYCPNPNSYRRYLLGHKYVSWTPDWGNDNRRSSFRVTGEDGNRHIENRIPGADANIYLVLAAIIFAGIDGIKNELKIDDEKVVMAAKRDFPMSMNDGLTIFRNSNFIKSNLGNDFTTLYAGVKQQELIRFTEQFTEWERATFGRQV